MTRAAGFPECLDGEYCPSRSPRLPGGVLSALELFGSRGRQCAPPAESNTHMCNKVRTDTQLERCQLQMMFSLQMLGTIPTACLRRRPYTSVSTVAASCGERIALCTLLCTSASHVESSMMVGGRFSPTGDRPTPMHPKRGRQGPTTLLSHKGSDPILNSLTSKAQKKLPFGPLARETSVS